MNRIIKFLPLFALVFFTACASELKRETPLPLISEVEFQGRKIELLDFVEGAPYRDVSVHFGSQDVTFILKGETDSLMRTSLEDAKVSLTQNARRISPINFKTRNLTRRKRNPADHFLYVVADEKNDEIYNIYRLNRRGGLDKLTDDSFIYGWTFANKGKGIFYAARSGPAEFTPGYLRYLDLVTGENKILFEDSKETRMTGGAVAVTKDGTRVGFSVICNQDREAKSLMVFSTETGQARNLLGCGPKRTLALGSEWVDDSKLVYSSDSLETGSRIYSVGETGKPRAISPRGWNTTQFRGTPPVILEVGGKSYIAVTDTRPDRGIIHLLTSKGRPVSSLSFKELITLEGHSDDAMAVTLTAGDQPFLMKYLKFDGRKFTAEDLAGISPETKNKLVNCEVEKVSYETFDKLSTPWERKRLHAYLYRPKKPAAKPDQRLLVEGFYGGSNRFLPQIQMFCSLGYYVLSPVTRGAWDWGQDLQNKIVGDLGGGETLDLVWAAKKFSRELEIPPEHVGVFGYSHGGYETLRALTLPESVNGIHPKFKFGFGVAHFPLSHIVKLMEQTNVPGWIKSLTGEDPRVHPQKWLERSPQEHADLASGPIFIAHGTNDKRIQIAQSLDMKRALDAAGKTSTLIEMEGQGHGFKGRDALVKVYKAQIDFFWNFAR